MSVGTAEQSGSKCNNSRYRGRFAPSPTGPLHQGSLLAALASFLQSRANNGLWYVRIEDLDHYRTEHGAADRILTTLERFGLEWDGTILYQSQRRDQYESALQQLDAQNLLFACCCSRKSVASQARAIGRNPSYYSGRCAGKSHCRSAPHALRVRTTNAPIRFVDRLQGDQTSYLTDDVGDFIIRRRDLLHAYQLAVVVDDHQQAISEVVRGIDLLESTPRQIYLQQMLGLPTPGYIHFPVLVDASGSKLSKQSFAAPVDQRDPAAMLFKLLQLLQQSPPKELCGAREEELLSWAIAHWKPEEMVGQATITSR